MTIGLGGLIFLLVCSLARPPLPVAISALAGSAALALAARQILHHIHRRDVDRAAALVFLLPSAVLNGTLGAHDTLWAAILLLSVGAALDRRHVAMLAWFGLAIGIGAQAALTAPIFVALLINRKVSPRLWPIAPTLAVVVGLAVGAAGTPATVALPLRQAITGNVLAFDAPNIWAILQPLPLGLPLIGLAIAVATGATAAFTAQLSARPLGGRTLLCAALLATLLTAGLMPLMHARAFFFADILSLVLALLQRDRETWRIALLVQAGSLLAMLGQASGAGALAMLGGGAMICATALVARQVLRPAANDNPIVARA